MIVKGHEGHVISVSTAFKVHYNQKLGGPIRPSWGERTMASGGIDAPAYLERLKRTCHHRKAKQKRLKRPQAVLKCKDVF